MADSKKLDGDEILALYEEISDDENLMFDRIQADRKRSNRPDIHALLLLDSLVPGNEDMMVATSHDTIWLAVGRESLSGVVTEEDIRDLIRCGVCFEDNESLQLFATG